LRKRLTADVAHELRTPLATLQSHMEAMIDGIWEPDTERLESCHEEILRIGRMVGDLEKLARFESENLVLNREPFDMAELVKRIIINFESDFRNKRVKIDFHGTEQIVTLDKDKISQVVVNLVSNALKYTCEGGDVKVGIRDIGDMIRLTVQDTGIGISEEDLPCIFERFYRADKSRNRLGGGSGIGLAITKAIVEAHTGTIKVTSRLGEGTEFVLELPKNMQ
jgi:two-component system, OmpR family, sensor histidine kinase BaeS